MWTYSEIGRGGETGNFTEKMVLLLNMRMELGIGI
jgi:hypothetical protein